MWTRAFKRAVEVLPRKIRVPANLGFRNPKRVTTLYVTDKIPRVYWTDRGYNRFSGS